MQVDSLLGSRPRKYPGRIALDDGERRVTYGQLPQLVNDEARVLSILGGNRFGLLARNGCAWAIADLALHQLQRLNVPLPGYFTSAQLRHVIDDAGIDTLLTDDPARVQDRWPEFVLLVSSPASGLSLLRRALHPDRVPGVPEGVTKVTYTSGSTSEPKGVCLSASAIGSVSRSLCAATASLRIRRHLSLLPLPTLLENIGGVHVALQCAATCILPPASQTGMDYGALDESHLLAALDAAQPESLILVPELLRILVSAARAGRALPSSLKFIALGGAPVSEDLLREAAELQLPVYEGYGLSECASAVCLNTPGAARRGSVGRPLPHARVRLDSAGQLLVSGAVMSGYLGAPLASPLLEVATGDIGEIDDQGYVHIRGRLRNIYITSLGRNVSPEWVEREITRDPAIQHAVVYGEGKPHAAALLSPARAGLDDSVAERAIARANTRLPDYALVRRWAWMPEIPSPSNGLLTASGRLRRDRVLERFASVLQHLLQTPSEASVS
ncbi:MAG: AMP-binding protein [Steroidobacteraceae bacterium]|nr:AMP-binding protein [Steroidobacteraceae bacterium]